MAPDEILRENRRRAQRAAEDVGAARLRALLERAAADLSERIAGAEGLRGAGAGSFTAVQARAVLRQVEDVLRALKPGMRDLVVSQAVDTAGKEVAGTLAYLREAEKLFTGVSTPLALDQAAVQDEVRSGAQASALRRILSDPKERGHRGVLDRYGESVVGSFEKSLQQRVLASKPWAEVRDDLTKSSPFLQAAPAHWAERIVRTESMHASNYGALGTMEAANAQLGGGMLKVLAASFDSRTAADSYAVHGQVRRVSEPFEDWTHAYQHPPNRPNDRETVVPHRVGWPLPASLKPKSDAEVAAAWARDGRRGSPPPRPRMSTVDLKQLAEEERARAAPRPAPTAAPAPAPEVAAPTPLAPAAPVRAPRFASEEARARHASRRLFELPEDQSFGIPDVVRNPLRVAGIDEVSALGPVRLLAANLTRQLRALERSGEAPPLRQVRVEQVRALDSVIREHVLGAIRQAAQGGGEAPVLVRFRGVLYAQEGVEAVVAAHLGERRTVQAHVVDLDAKRPWPAPPKKAQAPAAASVSAASAAPRVPVELVQGDYSDHVAASGLLSPPRYEKADFDAAVRKVFGKGAPTIETLQRTWGSTEAGHTVEITSVSAIGGKVYFQAIIRAADGRKIGDVTRSFIRHSSGRFEVHHDYFKINDVSEQGKKGGSTMLRQALQTYEHLGVDEVSVDAAWVGRYAWATFGYNWGGSEAGDVGRRLTRYLARYGVPAERAAAIAEQVKRRAWDVAALDVDGITVTVESEGKMVPCKVGKAFLLTGGMWSGKIVLDPKHETYKRAKERIGL